MPLAEQDGLAPPGRSADQSQLATLARDEAGDQLSSRHEPGSQLGDVQLRRDEHVGHGCRRSTLHAATTPSRASSAMVLTAPARGQAAGGRDYAYAPCASACSVRGIATWCGVGPAGSRATAWSSSR